MSKPKPGQVVLDAIDKAIVDAEPCTVPFRTNTHEQTVLRAYRAAFKKMAGIRPDHISTSIMRDPEIAPAINAILKARAVEKR